VSDLIGGSVPPPIECGGGDACLSAKALNRPAITLGAGSDVFGADGIEIAHAMHIRRKRIGSQAEKHRLSMGNCSETCTAS